MESPIQPNDVVIVLRPDFKEGEDWQGGFEIVIAGIGPVTMPEESMRELVSMAMLIATAVPVMEKDAKFTERLMTECAEHYGEADDVMTSDVDNDFVLTAHTKTVGGMQ
jgi:hypothetical protein